MKKFCIAVAIVGVFIYSSKLLIDSGVTYQPENYLSSTCTLLAPLAGSEDIEWSGHLGKAIVSSDPRPAIGVTDYPSGGLYALGMENNSPPEKITDTNFPFHPHGISLWKTSNGLTIFAINHRPTETTVEVFEYSGNGRARHSHTLRNQAFTAANDLVAISNNTFYFSKDHDSRSHIKHTVEHFLRIPSGSLHFFDGNDSREIDTRLFFANGLALDNSKNLLYVAAMLGKQIYVYDIKNPLRPNRINTILLPSAPDNLSLDADGTLLVATHPKLLHLKKHSEDSSYPSPSLALRILSPHTSDYEIRKLFADDGKKWSAISIVRSWPKGYLLGSIYTSTLANCSLRDESQPRPR